jgi:hypothetical protein
MKPRFSIKSYNFKLSILLLLFFEMVFVSPALGGNRGQDFLNYSYFSELGIGEYNTDDREVRAIQVPFSYQLREIEDKRWGIKLLFPVTFGVLGLDAINDHGGVISLDVQALTVVPGVEFQIPLRKRWVLKPFGQVGAGKDVSGGEFAYIYSTGLKSSYTIPWRKFNFTLGAGIGFDGFKLDGENRQDYSSISIGWDTVYPLKWTFKGKQTNIGGWVAYYYFLDDLEFQRPNTAPLDIGNQFEVALTFGTYKKIPIWFFKMNRIGLAYRFGEDLKAIRIVSEFPF